MIGRQIQRAGQRLEARVAVADWVQRRNARMGLRVAGRGPGPDMAGMKHIDGTVLPGMTWAAHVVLLRCLWSVLIAMADRLLRAPCSFHVKVCCQWPDPASELVLGLTGDGA